jgi:flagellar biosynthetic protein FliR
MRTFRVVPLGTYVLPPANALQLVRAASGVFLAAMELAAPILAATVLIEVAIALLSKLSPQLPVMSLTVPIKTLAGLALLTGALALWPRFFEARFSGLLDLAERLTAAQTDLLQADVAQVSTQLSLSETQQTALEDVIAQMESSSNSLFAKLA